MKLLDYILRTTIYLLTFATIGSSALAISDKFPDYLIEPKWFLSYGFLLILLIICTLSKIRNNNIINRIQLFKCCVVVFSIISMIESLIIILQKYVLQYKLYSVFCIGTFDNTAGLVAFQLLTLSFIVVFLKNEKLKQGPMVICIFIGFLSCLISMLLSNSRAGIVCITICLLALSWKQKKLWPFILFPCIFFFILFCSSQVKINSFKGRMFILDRTNEMILEKPVTGWGKNGFCSIYMLRQADYFLKYNDKENSNLADNIHHPLNEYAYFAVNYGIPITLSICFLFFMLACYIKKKSPIKGLEVIFITIALLSLFSYPFLYPITWISIFITVCLGIPIRYNRVVSIFVLILIIFVGIDYLSKLNQTLYIRTLQVEASASKFGSALPKYEELYNKKTNDCRFLYNYAVVLLEAGDYERADKIANECSEYLYDYDMCMLKGLIYDNLGKKDNACLEYQKAYSMCPSRIMPLYEQFIIFRDEGKKDQADSIRNIMILL